MKEKTKTVYYCEYCNKHGLSKHKMEYHEKICSGNPDNNRPCFSCIHLTIKKACIVNDNTNGYSRTINVNLLYCTNKKIYLYTPKNEVKGNMYDIDGDINNPMPKECDCFKEH